MRDDQSEFERCLRQQPMKSIPREWRPEILSAALGAQNSLHVPGSRRFAWLSMAYRQMSRLLWPNPAAWAALMAVWLVILGLNCVTHERPISMVQTNPGPTPEILTALHQQQQFYAELIGPEEPHAADRPRILPPQPRSQRLDGVAG